MTARNLGGSWSRKGHVVYACSPSGESRRQGKVLAVRFSDAGAPSLLVAFVEIHEHAEKAINHDG